MPKYIEPREWKHVHDWVHVDYVDTTNGSERLYWCTECGAYESESGKCF